MKTALVTGATGFIGANLTRRLLKDGHEVHLIVRPGFKKWRIEEINSSFILHECDIRNKSQVENVFKKVNPQWIFHLAAHGAYSYQEDLTQIVETNIYGINHLVEASLKVGFESFINVGSSSEYGIKDHAPKETEILEPNSQYALTKSYASAFCQEAAVKNNAQIITLRPYSVYGSFEEPTRFLPKLILHGRDGFFPQLVAGDIARDYLYVDDFVDVCIQMVAMKHQDLGLIYNVGTGIQTTIKEAVEVSKKIFGISDEPTFGSMKNRSWDTTVWKADIQRIKNDLGWVPVYSFEEGVKKMTEWFNENPAMEAFYLKQMGLKQVA